MAFLSPCLLCHAPASQEASSDGETVLIDCPTHGHFEVARTLWQAVTRMRPTERQRLFFQLEDEGRRRRLRLPHDAHAPTEASSGSRSTPRRRRP